MRKRKYKELSLIQKNIRRMEIETGKEMIKSAVSWGINIHNLSKQEMEKIPSILRSAFNRGIEYYALKAHGLNPYVIMGVA